MKKFPIRFQYNAPVIVSFALLSALALGINILTGGKANKLLFCVYRCSLRDALCYPRFFLHVLGHSGYSHYINNMLLLLVIGPAMEEKHGSKKILIFIVVTALVTGLAQFIFFPGSALLGASGVVFMLIMLSSLAGADNGAIPVTLILVAALYLGGEILSGVTKTDEISQFAHILGGVCGLVIGSFLYRGPRRRRR